MSRLAKKAIFIPAGVSVKQDGRFWSFSGPRGELKKHFPDFIQIDLKDGVAKVLFKENSTKKTYAMLGTSVALFKNYLKGVSEGFEKKLKMEGIGYKVQAEGDTLILSLGFTNPVKIVAPGGISFKVEKNLINISGIDKDLVGQVAATIRSQKPPEPYKGKGIRYAEEIIRRKAGKKAVAAA